MPTRIEILSHDGTPLVGDLTVVDGARSGVVVVHGHGSTRVNHADYCARLARAGFSALAVDLRGHGESEGTIDGGMPDDVRAAIDHLTGLGARAVGVRGSSLGGMLSLLVADHPAVRAVVAICPANNLGLVSRYPEYEWARALSIENLIQADVDAARGFWHARGDEVVHWAGTWNLYQHAPDPRHLRVVMGGDHRSLQHDPAIQDQTIGWFTQHIGHD